MSIFKSFISAFVFGNAKTLDKTPPPDISDDDPLITEFFKRDTTFNEDSDPLRREIEKENIELEYPEVSIHKLIERIYSRTSHKITSRKIIMLVY